MNDLVEKLEEMNIIGYHYLNRQELEDVVYKCEDLIRTITRELKNRDKLT